MADLAVGYYYLCCHLPRKKVDLAISSTILSFLHTLESVLEAMKVSR